MSQRDGVFIIDLYATQGRTIGKRWWVRIWDRRQRRYTASKTFETKDQARSWAVQQRADLDRGLIQPGKQMLASIGAEWIKEAERSGKNGLHVNRGRVLLHQLDQAGIKEVTSPHFAKDLTEWLQKLTAMEVNLSGKLRRKRKLQLSNATKNRLLSYVKAMIHLAMKRGRLAIDPLRGVAMLPEIKRIKPVFSVDELRHLLSDQYRTNPYWLVFALLTYTGMRFGEAHHLRWEWVDFASGVIVLRSHPDFRLKTHEERIVPLQPELADILRPMACRTGWIIANDALRNASQKLSWATFRRFLTEAGLRIDGRSPHSTRHTWISLMMATGTNVLDVKEWAGHRQLCTTEGYARQRSIYRTTVIGWPTGTLCLRSTPQVLPVNTGIVREVPASALVNLSAADDSVTYRADPDVEKSGPRRVSVTKPSGERDQTVG
jgi:integrase/recombinase XerC